MYYVQQHPELKVLTVVLSALACLHRKTGKEIDQVSFNDISHSDPLIESIDWQQAFDIGQDLEPTLEEDILLDHWGDFGAKETHWWLDFALSGGKRPLILHRCHRPRDSGKSRVYHTIDDYSLMISRHAFGTIAEDASG